MKTSLVAVFLSGTALGALAVALAMLPFEPMMPAAALFNLATALATTACAWHLTNRR